VGRLLPDPAGGRSAPEGRDSRVRVQALVLAEQLELRPLRARCHLGLGRLFRLVGRADAARTELSTAVELLRAMEMTFWLPEAEAELAKIG
jgi:hypothetical protein